MRWFTLLLFLLLGLSAGAVSPKGGVADVQVAGGGQSLLYQPKSANLINGGEAYSLGTAKLNFGGSLGTLFNWYGKKGVGVQCGVRLNLLRTTCQLDSVAQSAASDAVNGLHYVQLVRFHHWREEQACVAVSVPVGLAYRKPLGSSLDFYSAAGLEFLLPLSSHYKVTGGDADISAYYADYDVLLQNLPAHNLARVDGRPSGKFNMNVGLSAYADAGVRYHFYNLDASAALYAGYGLLNMYDEGDGAGIFNSQNEYSGVLGSTLVHSLHHLSFGVRLGVSLPLRR